MTAVWWLLAYVAVLAIIVLFMRGVKIVNRQADAADASCALDKDAPDVPQPDARKDGTMIIPAEEQRLLDTLPGDREAKEIAWRYGCLYGRYQAMGAANRAVHDLPSVFGLPDIDRATAQDELEQAYAELQRADIG